jgi:D-serine deaminase-like pyridoxal phosphate-dependent protein
VVGHAEWQPAKPSEEHLPVDCPSPADVPPIGATIRLVPRHVCPTINNFDEALLVRDGHIERVAAVTARGREGVGA